MFINNHLSLFDCIFNKFSSVLFYNQQKLSLKKSNFLQNLGGIIKNNNEIKYEGNHITVLEDKFNEKCNPTATIETSISIIDCSFISIQSSAIEIKNNKISLYITTCIFNSCKVNEGIICLESSRCLTITHTCCSDATCEAKAAFLYYDCQNTDFSICLYTTIVNTRSTNPQDHVNLICRSGDQYYICDNMTTCQTHGYQFEAPNCFSFTMMTVFDCDCSSVQFTGYSNQHCSSIHN